jgi:S-DNA-T family DNA segregation ATPase FtsK/SpoIIIE
VLFLCASLDIDKCDFDKNITLSYLGKACFSVGISDRNPLAKKGSVCLSDLENETFLIAGESGAGKSTLDRSIITNIILTRTIKEVELHLIDLKFGAEFAIFEKCGIVKSFSTTRAEAEATLGQLLAEVERRYKLFRKHESVDIDEYNSKPGIRKLNYKIIFIDEFADLQDEKSSTILLEELSSKARACGIHMVLATQRPDVKVINGRIRANVTCVIGLQVATIINSRIIIDEDGLEKLRGNGHGMLKHKGKISYIQSMFLSPQKARELLKPYYVKKGESKSEEPDQIDSFDFFDKL